MSKMDRVVVTELVRSFVLCLFIYLAAGSCAGRARFNHPVGQLEQGGISR